MWRLYWFYDAWGELLYVGQSNDITRRLREHERDAPWWPRFVAGGTWRPSAEVYYSLGDVLAAERVAIVRDRPLYNDTHNHGNPHRVTAIRPSSGRSTTRRQVPVRRRPWPRRRVRLVGAGAAWLAAAVAMTWAVLPAVPVGTALWLGPMVATVIVVAATRQSRRPRRRRW